MLSIKETLTLHRLISLAVYAAHISRVKAIEKEQAVDLSLRLAVPS